MISRDLFRVLRDFTIVTSLGVLFAWIFGKLFGEVLAIPFFALARFVTGHPLWWSLLLIVVPGATVSAIVIVELWRRLFPNSKKEENYWKTVTVVALTLAAIQTTGLYFFKSSFV